MNMSPNTDRPNDNTTSRDVLVAEAEAIKALNANVIEPTTDIGTSAIEYGICGWPVFPLRGKRPAIRGGRGLLDATTDIAQIAEWWGGQYRRANIGGRVPEGMVVIDIDPYHGGLDSLAALEKKYEPLPTTLTDLSGRGDGGAHYFFRRPPGQLHRPPSRRRHRCQDQRWLRRVGALRTSRHRKKVPKDRGTGCCTATLAECPSAGCASRQPWRTWAAGRKPAILAIP